MQIGKYILTEWKQTGDSPYNLIRDIVDNDRKDGPFYIALRCNSFKKFFTHRVPEIELSFRNSLPHNDWLIKFKKMFDEHFEFRKYTLEETKTALQEIDDFLIRMNNLKLFY